MSAGWTKVRGVILPMFFLVGFVLSISLLVWHRRAQEREAMSNSGTIVRVLSDKVRSKEKLVYMKALPDGGQCADGSPIQSQIHVLAGKGLLMRENCKNLPPNEQKPAPVTYHPADDRIIKFNGSLLSVYDWDLVFLSRDANDNLYTFGRASSPGFPQDEPKVTLQVLSKLNSGGKTLWSKFIAPQIHLREAKAMPSGEMVFIGYTRADESATVRGEAPRLTPSHILLLNAEGEQLWSRSYVSGFAGMFGNGITALETDSRGNIYVAGLHKDEGGVSYNLIMKLDHDGNTVWQKRLAVSAIEGLKVSPDGSLFVYGGSKESGGGLLVQLDPVGNMQRARVFGTDKIWSMALNREGKIIISGVTEVAGGEIKPFVASVSSSGRLEWAKNFFDKRYNFESPFISYVTAARDGAAYVASTVSSQAGEVGRVIRITEKLNDLKEYVFYSTTSPASILSELVLGAKGEFWAIARRTPEAMPAWLAYMGLLKLTPHQSQPCSTCFVVNELEAEDVALKSATGAASLENVTVELDRQWLDLGMVESPIPVPVF